MKKLLVTGGSGLLGAALIYELNRYFKVYAVYNQHKIPSRFAEGLANMKYIEGYQKQFISNLN